MPDGYDGNATKYIDDRWRKIFKEVYRPELLPCAIRILIVADGTLGFGNEDFGLSNLVSVLRALDTSYLPITVDLAHRGDPDLDPGLSAYRLGGAEPRFVFESRRLLGYHQLWLFGFTYESEYLRDRGYRPLSNNEVLAIKDFMDRGGGVFATGDHENLGVDMGGYIPRVRSMRKWFWHEDGTGGPQGEPIAPSGSDATRHDTNRPGRDGTFRFEDQSDDIPQTVEPHYFGNGLIEHVHPLLCTRAGPVRVLPDHPHEGECIVPRDLNANYSVGTDSFREFPTQTNGYPLSPVIVATSTILPGARTNEDDVIGVPAKPPAIGGMFGAIGAWDGHRLGNYGRIVVDSTFHHFVNVNLTGMASLGTPDVNRPETLGFLYSQAGIAHLANIHRYYRNIVDWLTPRDKKACLLRHSLKLIANDGNFLANVQPENFLDAGNYLIDQIWHVSPCERVSLLDPLNVALRDDVRAVIDPFTQPPYDQTDPEDSVRDEQFRKTLGTRRTRHIYRRDRTGNFKS